MNTWLAIVGVVIVLVLGGVGFLVGELTRIKDDPEVRAEEERRKKEEERQRTWKEKLK